jgi:hypothetical protein
MKKIKVFVIEYTHEGQRQRYPESLSSQVALAMGRELARLGRRPTVRRFDLPESELEQLLIRYEWIASEGRPRRKLL